MAVSDENEIDKIREEEMGRAAGPLIRRRKRNAGA